ncbi:MAG TPA: nuclear transport factor 2 family protein [Kineosporiaceae bacterium]|nr:nuclear transport factor 2 family protein [Kineosporiaceae bacterium]
MDDLLKVRQAFDDAELRADRAELDSMLVDDFLSIGERGFVLDKRQWIARHDDFRYLGIDTTEIDARRYERAAIIRCVQRSQAIWQGAELNLSVRLSQVWVQQAGPWRLAGIQFSSLAAE